MLVVKAGLASKLACTNHISPTYYLGFCEEQPMDAILLQTFSLPGLQNQSFLVLPTLHFGLKLIHSHNTGLTKERH